MSNLFFYLGLGTLFTHELDAISNHEWRVIPILQSLPELIAMNTFILLHIPIFAVLVALVASTNVQLRERSRLGVSIFLIVHALLHLWFRNDVSYEFASMLSNVLIFGGALFGAFYLAISYKDLRQVY
jgi:apolipoprotein N-acyltransferase